MGDTISRDHSTVINSIKKTGDLRLTDYHFTASFNLCLDGIAESNSKYVQRLSTEQSTMMGKNELHKSVHALTVVHEFMLAYSAHELRIGDGYPSTDELLEDLKALRLKAIKLGF